MSPTEHPSSPYDARGAFAVLGLTPPVSQADIRHAFRRRLREHHPDTRLGSQPLTDQQRLTSDVELQRILRAYETLQRPSPEVVPEPDGAVPGKPASPRSVRVTSTAQGRRRGPDIVATPVQWIPPEDQGADSPAPRVPASHDLGTAERAATEAASVIYIWRLLE